MPLKIKKILHPTDFSDVSLEALAFARELTSLFDAHLHCIHVIDEAYQYWTAMGPESVPVGPGVQDLNALAEAQMQRFADEHLVGLKYIPVTKLVVGRPFAQVIAYARENLIDLIVVGTHGRGGLAHVLLGSTAERIVRKAPCPVLTVRAKDHRFEMP